LEQAVGDGVKGFFKTFSVYSLACFDSKSAMSALWKHAEGESTEKL